MYKKIKLKKMSDDHSLLKYILRTHKWKSKLLYCSNESVCTQDLQQRDFKNALEPYQAVGNDNKNSDGIKILKIC